MNGIDGVPTAGGTDAISPGDRMDDPARRAQHDWVHASGVHIVAELATSALERSDVAPVILGVSEMGDATMCDAVALELADGRQFWVDAAGQFAIRPGRRSRSGAIYEPGESYSVAEMIADAFPDLGLTPDGAFDPGLAASELGAGLRNRLGHA